MTKHRSVLVKFSFVALLFSLFAFGSCTKHVTQVVDQNYSTTYKILPTDWAVDTSNTNYYYVNMNVPEVNNEIFNNGGVVVYGAFVLDGNGNPLVWDALPEEVVGVSYNVYHSNSTITIGRGDPSAPGATDPGVPQQNIFFKVVVMDATPLD